jgi:hypothetical protein
VPRFEASPQPGPALVHGPSWAPAFPPEQIPQLTQLEQDLIEGAFREAIQRCDALSSELLADTAEQHGLESDERKPMMVALCLGLPAERWRMFRALVHQARLGAEVTELEALDAYAILIELNRLRRLASRPVE